MTNIYSFQNIQHDSN